MHRRTPIGHRDAATAMEALNSLTAIAPLLLRNLVTSAFIFADKSFLSLAEKYRLLELLRYLVLSSFLFFLSFLPSLFPSSASPPSPAAPHDGRSLLRPPKPAAGGGPRAAPPHSAACDSGIARALSQLLAIVNNVPVSSRKYEAVRSLAERLIDENQQEGTEALLEVNRTVLSAAFSRTLSQLEAAMVERERQRGCGAGGSGSGKTVSVEYKENRVLRAIRSVQDVARRGRAWWSSEEPTRLGSSAEKLAAELVWLAQKLVACGSAEDAVCSWASASNLAWLAISAEPRLQGSLVKVSAFLFKQAKDMGLDEIDESKKEQQRQTRMKMLMSWLPLLCRASNGTDAPVLSLSERAELERVLEQTIEMLGQEEEQEEVLSQWLHHFMYCPSSDWPNLHASYTRWCAASRKLLLLQ
ncbi:hypothetical protein EUGRSUZ_I02660 [Eucalyptus grandis]|uniref:1,8-cineole synthase n=2 Tax=Eucalyptus grandis TaxID=71139 RepID=A0A059AU93_EUCGR|nr:hypothetical protein EUGRSUZ_I02660 [Eucalyptus grandis]